MPAAVSPTRNALSPVQSTWGCFGSNPVTAACRTCNLAPGKAHTGDGMHADRSLVFRCKIDMHVDLSCQTQRRPAVRRPERRSAHGQGLWRLADRHGGDGFVDAWYRWRSKASILKPMYITPSPGKPIPWQGADSYCCYLRKIIGAKYLHPRWLRKQLTFRGRCEIDVIRDRTCVHGL